MYVEGVLSLGFVRVTSVCRCSKLFGPRPPCPSPSQHKSSRSQLRFRPPRSSAIHSVGTKPNRLHEPLRRRAPSSASPYRSPPAHPTPCSPHTPCARPPTQPSAAGSAPKVALPRQPRIEVPLHRKRPARHVPLPPRHPGSTARHTSSSRQPQSPANKGASPGAIGLTGFNNASFRPTPVSRADQAPRPLTSSKALQTRETHPLLPPVPPGTSKAPRPSPKDRTASAPRPSPHPAATHIVR